MHLTSKLVKGLIKCITPQSFKREFVVYKLTIPALIQHPCVNFLQPSIVVGAQTDFAPEFSIQCVLNWFYMYWKSVKCVVNYEKLISSFKEFWNWNDVN